MKKIKVGDFVIYRKFKASTHPSPRARDIFPAAHGDTYSYGIDKFWKVVQLVDESTVEVVTRRGKRKRFDTNAPNWRKAGLIARLLYRDRFF